jgi:hypothetical protein
LNLPPLPHLPPFLRGKLAVSVRFSYVGDAYLGNSLVKPLRQAAPLLLDTVQNIRYADFASITNDPTEPAVVIEHFGLLRELTAGAVDTIVDIAGPNSGSRLNIVNIRHLGGAFSRPPSFWNAVGARDAAFAFFGLTMVPPGHKIVDYVKPSRDLATCLKPWRFETAHPNFLGPADATEVGTSQAYEPEVYQRLQGVKAKYDPDNLFRTNHNIPPNNSR